MQQRQQRGKTHMDGERAERERERERRIEREKEKRRENK